MLIKRILSLLTAAVFALSLAGCIAQESSPKDNHPELDVPFAGRQYQFTYAPEASEMLTLSQNGADAIMKAVNGQTAEFPYADLYELEEVEKRLLFDASVETHQYSALNDAGVLDAAHLAQVVQQNNAAYLAENTFGFQELDAAYLMDICRLIVAVMESMRQAYPDIDWPRVYCNLGQLKILYRTAMLNFAEVSADLVLGLNDSTTQIAQIMKGEDAFRNVLIHESMHMIQLGCACEQIEGCSRRCGISIYWTDFPANSADFGWLFEGSAERAMCTLTGDPAITYQYKMDYICSYTMSILMRDEVDADTMETLHFYDDPQQLFDAFGCETEQERQELLKAVITTNVLQMQPKGFHSAYKEAYGTDLTEDSDALNQFYFRLKPPICITLAKEFFQNLVPFIQENQISANDLFFLLRIFEGHMNQHMYFPSESKKEINQTFLDSYLVMRKALFENLSTELDLETMYSQYNITAGGENTLNAQLEALPEDKRLFLAERAQWLDDLDVLNYRIPAA